MVGQTNNNNNNNNNNNSSYYTTPGSQDEQKMSQRKREMKRTTRRRGAHRNHSSPIPRRMRQKSHHLFRSHLLDMSGWNCRICKQLTMNIVIQHSVFFYIDLKYQFITDLGLLGLRLVLHNSAKWNYDQKVFGMVLCPCSIFRIKGSCVYNLQQNVSKIGSLSAIKFKLAITHVVFAQENED